MLVRAATDEVTVGLVDAVQREGTCWCGPTMWQGRPAMRVSISGWSTTAGDIDRSATAIVDAAHGLTAIAGQGRGAT